MNCIKIKKLQIRGGPTSLDDINDKLVFDLSITKPINVFCLPNGAGKSTLFLIIKDLIGLNPLSKDLVNIDNDGEKFVFKKVNLTLSIGSKIVCINNINHNFSKLSFSIDGVDVGKSDIEELYKISFNQDEYLTKLLPNGSEWTKSGIKSLARAFCLGDDTYYHRTKEKDCNLIDNHQDGSFEKMIFFYYLLGEDLDGDEGKILSMTADYTNSKENLSKINSLLASEGYELGESNLFDPLENYKKVEKKLSLIQSEYRKKSLLSNEIDLAISKILKIKTDNYDDNLNPVLDKEVSDLEKYKSYLDEIRSQLREEIKSIKNDSNVMIELEKCHRVEILLKEKEIWEEIMTLNQDGQKYLEDGNQRKILENKFKVVYKELLRLAGYSDEVIDMRLDENYVGDLRLKLKKGKKQGDAHLRVIRTLILSALQIYKIKHPSARMPGMALFDAAMDGVGNENILNFFIAIIKFLRENEFASDVQLLYFFPKYSSKDREIEDFLLHNEDIVYVHQMEGDKLFNI